jgi:cytochrome c oxidase subunit 2
MGSKLSNISSSVDAALYFIVAISVVMLALVTFFMVYFSIRYSRKRNAQAEEIEGNTFLEIAWTVIPTILVLFMFYAGYVGFKLMRTPPPESMLVKVTSRMWAWSFRYETGRVSDELVLPVGEPVRLAMTAEDVLHSLSIPAFRVKEDNVPGQETMLWFIPNQAGTYDLFCTEYCGVGHSSMITKVRVLEGKEFEQWLEAEEEKAAPEGLRLLRSKGCIGCHSIDGSRMVGPTFQGAYGSRRIVMTDGREREISFDEEYLTRSILYPKADIAKGYPPVMPEMELTKEEVAAIVEYIKGLGRKTGKKEPPPPEPQGLPVTEEAPAAKTPDGLLLLEGKGCIACHSLDGTRRVGPTLKGLFGTARVVVTGGVERKVTADEEYVKRSIMEPGADIAKGYPPVMPAQSLTGDELTAVVEYLKELR